MSGPAGIRIAIATGARDRRGSTRRAGMLRLALVCSLAIPSTGVAREWSSRAGDPSMPPPAESVIVGIFERLRKSQDLEEYRRDVKARFNEATLCRIAHSGDVRTRRAAAVALGLDGSYAANACVAGLLKDRDPDVRSLAAEALWAIWSRADTPEGNVQLEEIQRLIGLGRLGEAVHAADRLIERSPGFAEAYNQRAIARFLAGRLEESVADCRRVIERNPYHFGALSGMGQAQIRLGRRAEALRTFRRALALQPYSNSLREVVAGLEAAGD